MHSLSSRSPVVRLDLNRLPVSSFRDDEAFSAPARSPFPSISNPFDDLDVGTRNLIQDLYREKDEVRNNYSKETKKTSQLEAQLVVAEGR